MQPTQFVIAKPQAQKDPNYIWEIFFKTICFLTHFSFAVTTMIFLVDPSYCNINSNRRNYWITSTNASIHANTKLNRSMWPVMVPNVSDNAFVFDAAGNKTFVNSNHTCQNKDALCSLNGITPSLKIDYVDTDLTLGGVNNIWFLMMLFEWITASFALQYLLTLLNQLLPKKWMQFETSQRKYIILSITVIWNILIFISLIQTKIPANNINLMVLLFICTCVTQAYYQYEAPVTVDPNSPLNIMTRYIEYAITAPVLMISVQTIMTTAPGWSILTSYVAMTVTNLVGVPLHVLSIDFLRSIGGSKEDNHRVFISMCLFTSWIAFSTAWIVYFYDVANVFDRIPNDGIKALIILLPIFFASFGVISTVTVYLPLLINDKWKNWANNNIKYMDSTYDFLSLTIKILTVILVISSDIFKPSSSETCL